MDHLLTHGQSVYRLSPDALDALRRVATEAATDAANRAIENFLAGAKVQNVFLWDPATAKTGRWNPEEEWRADALARYEKGSWNHTLLTLVPFRRFRPVDIYKTHEKTLAERHPTHHNHPNGTTNTILALVADGALARVGRGVYAPAVKGIPLPTEGREDVTPGEDDAEHGAVVDA